VQESQKMVRQKIQIITFVHMEWEWRNTL